MREIVGIERIRAAFGDDSTVDTMKRIGIMRLAGYRAETDRNGTWRIQKAEIRRFQRGKPPLKRNIFERALRWLANKRRPAKK